MRALHLLNAEWCEDRRRFARFTYILSLSLGADADKVKAHFPELDFGDSADELDNETLYEPMEAIEDDGSW